jgi:PKD repeat protein/dienelactone hydrolase
MKTGVVLVIAILLTSILSTVPMAPAAAVDHKEISRSDPPKPEGEGPIPVGFYNDTLSTSTKSYTVKVMVFYPAQSNGSMTPSDKSKAPYPTIIVLPFFGGDQMAMGGLASMMTSWGLVTMTVAVNWTDFPDASNESDMNDYLDYLEAQNATPASPLYQMVDKEAFGLSGYSSGGGIAIIDTALVDRIKAVETLAAAIGKSTVDAIASYFTKPVLLQVGQDDLTYKGGSEEAYKVFNVPRSLRMIYGASHGGPFINYLFPAFFLYQFGRVPSYETYIYGEEAVKDNVAMLYTLSFNRSATDFFPPIASAWVTKGSVNMDEDLAFNASLFGYWPKTYSQNRFQWDIDGDGTTEIENSTSLNNTWHYIAPGVFTPRFTYSAGSVAIASVTTNMVNVKNVPPVAIAGEDISINEDQDAHFGGSSSYDTSSDSLVFKWAFGDGAIRDFDANPLVDHTYKKAGVYVATLTAKDLYGATSTDKLNVSVKNVAPVADAGNTVLGLEEDIVRFTGNGTDTTSDISTLMFKWDFGDGNSSEWNMVQTGAHSYPKSGNYTATFFVKDDNGAITNDTVLVKISDVAPFISLVSPDNNTEFDEDSLVEFQGAGGDTSSDIASLQYMWDLGDGTKTAWSPLAQATHTFIAPGSYRVTLWVKDNDGLLANGSTNVTIKNLAPGASIVSPAPGLSVKEDQNVTFNGSGEDTASDLSGLTYEWTIDGKVFETQGVLYSFSNPGTYDISMKVTDPHGASSNTTIQITVTNVAPTLTAQIDHLSFKAGGYFNFSAEGNDTVSDRANLTYKWTFDDGFFANTSIGAHTFGVAGTYNVKVVVTDEHGATATKTFSVVVAPADKPPVVDHPKKGPNLMLYAGIAVLVVAAIVAVIVFLLYGRGKKPKDAPKEVMESKTPEKMEGKRVKKETGEEE